MDLKLDVTTGDLDVTTGDAVLLAREDAIAQNLRIRLQFFQGEWFLDQRLGVPYYQQILVKNPSTSSVRALLRETVLETPGVLELQDFRTDYDNAARSMRVEFTARVEGTDTPLDFSTEFVIG